MALSAVRFSSPGSAYVPIWAGVTPALAVAFPPLGILSESLGHRMVPAEKLRDEIRYMIDRKSD